MNSTPAGINHGAETRSGMAAAGTPQLTTVATAQRPGRDPRMAFRATLVALAMATLIAAPGQASRPAPGSDDGLQLAAATAATQTVDARQNDGALSYWTAERLKASRDALPGVRGKPGDVALVERGKPFELMGGAPKAGAKASAPDATATRSTRVSTPSNLSSKAATSSTAASEGYWQGSNTASPNSQIGHLFFQQWDPTTRKWLDYNCSGTVVNSANKSVVWTAGHCVYNTFANTWNRNYVFCPGYRAGSCALGKWTAAVNATTTQWQNATCTFDGRCTEAEFLYDLGALKMNLNNGWRIGDWVGYHGIKFNGATTQNRYLFGYPLNKASGEYLYYCYGTNTVAWSNLRMAPCTAGGGASGGPWLSEINASWLGVVQSVNSHGDNTYMTGPYMGTVAQILYGTVSN